jgi:eukaryotic-like serine/threonine-protein kinase
MQPSSSGQSRYELREVIGRGGMGVIYVAWDRLMRREVALKTIIDVTSPEAVDLFYREWGVQASITHPNIVEIYDIGEMEQEGARRPYFVMPLLEGATLSDLICSSSSQLTLERIVHMIVQVCRGLQAAHDRDLIHRDLKPSNVFVLRDDSIKILDFGIARAGGSAQTAVRGTLSYMAPELLQMKPASVASDIYAVGVLAYEALSGRRPFGGVTDEEVSRSITHHNPPAISDINHSVPMNVSRAVAKAMAKQPWHRYSTAREFGDILYRAFRGEAIGIFDAARVQPRVERAKRAFEQGEYPIAGEILAELESEGFVEQEITTLRRQVEQAQRRISVRALLDGARRFNDEEEFTLALRKVQEALDFDPQNTDAHALKAEIERRRRSRKVEEWAKIARQHLDNNAFDHARQALNSLLELRPNEPHAVAMLAEIQRKEEEFERGKEEKNHLFSSARAAFERGEVTSALTQLEHWMELERSAPDTQSERLLSMQSFYQQVRGEHEAIRSAYDQARQHLAEGRLEPALATCDQYLAKYPDHALFQALQFDILERKRQNLSSLIAETDRRVEAEPDLERRIAILEDAAAQYPEEDHFQRALRFTRDKRVLVDTVVSKARLFEDESRFSEALDQWEMLQAIHPGYPGLEFEIERVRTRRQSQARQEARSRWINDIDHLTEGREFDRALAAAQQALHEFPGDPELLELHRQAEAAAKQAAQARALAEQAQEARSVSDWERAVTLLRQATELDSADPDLRAALVQALADQARALSQQSPQSAEPVVEQLLELDPSHTLGLNLRAIREDQAREEFVSWCTAQARKLQSAGDLEGAAAIVRQGVDKHPREPRLQQLLTNLERVLGDQERTATRSKDIALLNRFLEKGELVKQEKTAGRVLRSLDEISGRHPNDGEIQVLIQRVRASFGTSTPSREAPTNIPSPPPIPTAPIIPSTEPQPAASPLFATQPVEAAPPPPPPTAQAPKPAKAPAGASPIDRLLPAALSQNPKLRNLVLAAGVMIVLLGVVAILRQALAPSASTVPVAITTTPSGASIRIAGENKGVSNLTLHLALGDYQAEALLDGYEPATTRFTVRSGEPFNLSLNLNRWRSSFRLYSDAEDGKATFGDRPLATGPSGDIFYDGFDDGDYELRYASRAGEVSAALRYTPDGIPILATPPQAKNFILVLVHQRGDRAIVYTNAPGARASLDGAPAEPIPPDGHTFSQLAPGDHRLTIEEEKMVRTITFTSGGGPAVNAFIFTPAAPDRGTLLLLAGVDGAQVTINNRRHWQLTRNGQVRIASLAPGNYEIRVSRDGYEPPAPQRVQINSGEEARLEFELKPVARMATLNLSGPAAAQVFIDGNLIGDIDSSGSFSTPVTPGAHTLELRRGAARSRPLNLTFRAGETLSPSANELALVQPDGTVRFEVSPAGATLLLRRQGEPESTGRRVTGSTMSLAEGSYAVVGSAPGHTSAQVIFAVQPGAAITVPVRLAAEATKAAPKAVPTALGMADFDEPNEWDNQDGWWVRRGGNYATYSRTPANGTFSFTIHLRRGKRLQWFANYRDERNHLLFRVDRRSFYRLSVVNGRTTELERVDHGLEGAHTFTFRVAITPGGITHQLSRRGEWVTIDNWTNPPGDPTAGKFGFYIPGGKFLTGSDEYGLRDFQFSPGAR